MLPCAGQGALGIEVRSDAHALRGQLGQLTHRPTWLAVQAERAVSRSLGGSCSVPLAAHAIWTGGELSLRAVLGHAVNVKAPLLRASLTRPVVSDDQARSLGETVAQALRESGAADYLDAATAAGPGSTPAD